MSENKPKLNIPRSVRLWLYGIAVATAALLTGYGVITASEGGLWLSLIGAILVVAPVAAVDNISDE